MKTNSFFLYLLIAKRCEMDIRELDSLIKLLDDPDQEVFGHVEQKLLTMGADVIAPLESAWETSFDALAQNRIENLIHKIQFDQVCHELRLWKLTKGFDLLSGLLIVNKYQYPDMDEQKVVNLFEEMKRAVWLEMIYEMSPVEKVRLLNNIIFNDFGFSGNTQNYHDPQNSYIGPVSESKKGNPILLSCIYSIVAQRVDIPIYGVNLPKHFILAYTHHHQPDLGQEDILFYINAFNRGQIFGRHDVLAFLKQLDLPYESQFMLPCTHIEIIQRVLRNLQSSYNQMGHQVKKDEIEILLGILTEKR